MADGERQFWSRSRPFEDGGITSIFGGGFRGQLGKLFREMPRVVRDHDLRSFTSRGFAGGARIRRAYFMQVTHKSLRGPADIEKIHRVGPNTRELRSLV